MKLKKLNVRITYTATLGNVEVSEKEYEALKDLAEHGSGDPLKILTINQEMLLNG